MKPRGPLMVEHRLIERMLEIVRNRMSVIDEHKSIDSVFIDSVVDFIRTYADRTHHGKEEDILFRDLAKKNMIPEEVELMKELIEEHKYARRVVTELVQAKGDYLEGNQNALQIIKGELSALVKFYPEHITKEDKIFFVKTEKYLTDDEQSGMLQEFWEFDRRMIHDKYKSVVESLKMGKSTQILT